MLKNVNVRTLAAALLRDNPLGDMPWAMLAAQKLVACTVERLEPNVQEYLAGQRLSEIPVTAFGRVFSVPRLMAGGYDFLTAIRAVNALMTDAPDTAIILLNRDRM